MNCRNMLFRPSSLPPAALTMHELLLRSVSLSLVPVHRADGTVLFQLQRISDLSL
jgi:hypothetical protein